MRYKIFIIIAFLSFIAQAQIITIGESKKIQSTALNEEREYWVYLPDNYSNTNFKTQKYPAIYLLDGEKYFHVTTGIVKNLSNGYYPQIPECIVIAIKNTNRSRDLTPTYDPNLPYKSGGSTTFEAFITKELIPEINNNYRTLDYKILIGHSFGGLFAINNLLKNTPYFNAYIAIDPSLWWNNNTVVKNLNSSIKTTNFKGKSLFLANANSLGNQKKPSKQHYAHFKAKKKTLELLDNNAAINLNYTLKTYKNEDHGSVVLPALIDGLRITFKGFRINVKELISTPSILEKHYKELSSNLGFTFEPQAAYIDRVVDLAIKRNQKENAIILNNINKNLYPMNAYLKEKMN